MNYLLRCAGLLLAGICLLFAGISSRAESPVRIPLESFFAEPDCAGMQLAPDGKHLAFLSMLGHGKVGVALMDLTTGQYEPLVSAHDENIKTFLWKGSDCIVYAADIGGGESYAWRSIGIKPSKPGKPRRVIALSEAYQERYNEKANFMFPVDELKYDPRHMLIFGRQVEGGVSAAMMLIDVTDGHRTLVGDYRPVDADLWLDSVDSANIADNTGALRARVRVDGNKVIFEVRPIPAGPYVAVATFPAGHAKWEMLFFAADNETLYFWNREHSDTRTLHTINVRTQQVSAPIFTAPEGEMDDVITSWDRSVLLGVTYTADKTRYHFFDSNRAQLQKTIDAALPDTVNDVIGTSSDEKVYLILAASDRDPGTYYVLDVAQKRLGPVGKRRIPIKPEEMRPMEPISFVARDGLTIHGYLTRPAGAAGAPGPLILLPHGGPYGIRDTWGFNREVQFLANRGYSVLQVNFRGSGGYGGSFERAGYREWGGKMQDDLTDAVKWAVAQEIADPRRVAIYGASFGGYAALAGMVFTPELYCCGANYLGPADLGLLVGVGRNTRSAGAKSFFEQVLGADKDYLRTRSPVNYIQNLRAPLFNGYGRNDARVDFKQWSRLEAKLKQHEKVYEILVEDNEGHGFRNEKNRLDFYRRLEAFFDKYLGAAPSVGITAPVTPAR